MNIRRNGVAKPIKGSQNIAFLFGRHHGDTGSASP